MPSWLKPQSIRLLFEVGSLVHSEQENTAKHRGFLEFNRIIRVANGRVILRSQSAWHLESRIQESVVIEVVELLHSTVCHQDVTSSRVNGEPVTRILKVSSSRVVDKSISPIDAKAMFTVDAGEAFTFRKVNKSPLAIGPLAQRGSSQAAAVLPPSASTPAGPAASTTNAAASVASGTGSLGVSQTNAAGPEVAKRFPTPEKMALTKSRETLREIYNQAFSTAKTDVAKQALAQRLFDDAQGFEAGSADRFAMLTAAGKLANSTRALALGFSVVDATSTEYDVDYYRAATGLLKRLGKISPQELGASGSVERLKNLLQTSLQRDDFQTFEKLFPSLKSVVGMRRDPIEIEEVKQMATRSKWLKREYLKVRGRLGSGDMKSEENKSIFGAYYCFAKGDFAKGLPLLAEGNDLQLRAIAEKDLVAPSAAEDQLKVGDGWWNLGEKEKAKTAKTNLQKRAAHWYELALQQLPSGLDRVKAEMRYSTVMGGANSAAGSLPPNGLGGRRIGAGVRGPINSKPRRTTPVRNRD